MAYQCKICSKKGQRGNLVSHSKRRSKHIYKPNLRWASFLVNGTVKKAKICMDCLSKLKKENRILKFNAEKLDNNGTLVSKTASDFKSLNKDAEKIESKATKIEKVKSSKKEVVKEKTVKKEKLSGDLKLANEILGGLEKKDPKLSVKTKNKKN